MSSFVGGQDNISGDIMYMRYTAIKIVMTCSKLRAIIDRRTRRSTKSDAKSLERVVLGLPAVNAAFRMGVVSEQILDHLNNDDYGSASPKKITEWLTTLESLIGNANTLASPADLPEAINEVLSRSAREHLQGFDFDLRELIIGLIKARSHLSAAVQSDNPNEQVDALIPRQVEAPIITDIRSGVLVAVEGDPLEATPNARELAGYLAAQVHKIVADLNERSNVSRSDVEIFEEFVDLLTPWSVTRVLSLGAHLQLLDQIAPRLLDEVLEPTASRIRMFTSTARNFVNTFDVWHEYVAQSLDFNLTLGGGSPELNAQIVAITNGLRQARESVDPKIPNSLKRLNEISSDTELRFNRIGSMSVLRSLKNISISLTSFVSTTKKTEVAEWSQATKKMLRLVCRLYPSMVPLAASYIDLGWLIGHDADIKMICKLIADQK